MEGRVGVQVSVCGEKKTGLCASYTLILEYTEVCIEVVVLDGCDGTVAGKTRV